MLGRKIKVLSMLAMPLVAAGCVSTDYAAKDAGFLNVSLKAGEATGKQTVWASRHESVESVRLLRTYGDHAARMDVSRRSGLRSRLSVEVQM